MVQLYILRFTCHYFEKKNIEILSLKIDFVLANSADSEEVQHSAAFHLGLHSLLMSFLYYVTMN